MPRPVWTGSISFGMVAIPIRLVPAVRKKSISFNQLDERDQSRIRYRKVNEDTGEEVPTEHIVKGYDIGSSQYVILTDDDLAPLAPAKSKEINLETFVPVEEVNPLMYDSSYLVLPDKNAKPYALLAEAMADTGRLAVGRFVMRQKEYLAAIRSDGKHLTLSTLVFPDELVAPDSIEEYDQLDGIKVSDKELTMAKGLVDALSDDFEPDQFTDEYRAAVEHIIEQKAAGVTPTFEEAPKERGTVIDLAAALEASLAEARQAKGRHPAGKAETAAAAPTAAKPKRRTTKKAQPELEDVDEPAVAKTRTRARKSA